MPISQHLNIHAIRCKQQWQVVPRINAVSTSYWRSDLSAMFACHKVAPSGCSSSSKCNSCAGGRSVYRQGASRLEQLTAPNQSYLQPCQVQSAEDVRCIDAELCAIEASLRLKHRLCMIPWIETALGVLNASAICSASPRVAAVAFGCEDFARDLQLPHEVPASALHILVYFLVFI